MKALSVRAPWWWAILHGKDIENRDWPTRFRGRVLIHASKWWSYREVVEDARDIYELIPSIVQEGDMRNFKPYGGHIVGSVEIVDCVNRSNSPWFFGSYGFVLARPVTFAEPIPFKGALGFFDVPDNLIPNTTEAASPLVNPAQ